MKQITEKQINAIASYLIPRGLVLTEGQAMELAEAYEAAKTQRFDPKDRKTWPPMGEYVNTDIGFAMLDPYAPAATPWEVLDGGCYKADRVSIWEPVSDLIGPRVEIPAPVEVEETIAVKICWGWLDPRPGGAYFWHPNPNIQMTQEQQRVDNIKNGFFDGLNVINVKTENN